MRKLIGCLLVIGGTMPLSGCQGSPAPTLWMAPGDYDMQMVVTERGATNPQSQQSRDSAVVRVYLDSLVRDSVFGSYALESVHSLGIMAGRATPGPQLVAGSVKGERFTLSLSPDARDAGVSIEGTSANRVAEGTWRLESGATKGRVRLSRR